jgi:hypothetical protein
MRAKDRLLGVLAAVSVAMASISISNPAAAQSTDSRRDAFLNGARQTPDSAQSSLPSRDSNVSSEPHNETVTVSMADIPVQFAFGRSSAGHQYLSPRDEPTAITPRAAVSPASPAGLTVVALASSTADGASNKLTRATKSAAARGNLAQSGWVSPWRRAYIASHHHEPPTSQKPLHSALVAPGASKKATVVPKAVARHKTTAGSEWVSPWRRAYIAKHHHQPPTSR